MVEPRLTRDLYETVGEDAYINEAIVLTRAENRAQIRAEVLTTAAESLEDSGVRAVKKTFRRGYGGETLATVGMCHLVAYFEEWEGFDFDSLREALLDAHPSHRFLTPERLAVNVTVGLGGGLTSRSYDRLRELIEAQPAMKRIDRVMEPMFVSSIRLPSIKRRHVDDYAYAWNIAKAIGLALGTVDRTGLVPGIAPARLQA